MDKNSLQNRLKAAEAEIAKVRRLMQEQEEQTTKPPKWEDLGKVEGFYINNFGYIIEHGFGELCTQSIGGNKNTFPTREQAEATIAEAQLLQLRDSKFYRNGWKPDWSDKENKIAVFVDATEGLGIRFAINHIEIWSFQDEKTAERFLNDQRELLEIWAKKTMS